ncbi:rna-binding protein [Vairimorpha apis BRL 01]|uniref:Rna-binding protein n=1 Tax=Vairimorpha apis BRL 01 TaxID=1037528 RepID=T0L6R0_9MICR|nr:rna-binding protein [Vairimorpha apis BRL 01]
MKQRFNFLDIRSITKELNPLLSNKFIQNIYSYQQRLFYIKFSSKHILLIEPGIRFHLVNIECSNGLDNRLENGNSSGLGNELEARMEDGSNIEFNNKCENGYNIESNNKLDINSNITLNTELNINSNTNSITSNIEYNTNLNINPNYNIQSNNLNINPNYNLDIPNTINHFCKILRSRIRRSKLISLYQVGFDRVVVLQLSNYKLVIEFF